ncbi:MAG: site-2 protease family protein [Thermoplasmatota archaeon]
MADLFPIVLISVLVLYVLFVVWLLRTGRLAKWNLSLMLGIVLMQRTHRGKATIDFIARPRRFWNLVGDVGIVLTLGGMVAITLFFLWSVGLALQPHSGVPALGVKEIFVIPGVNPFVPLWYGIGALIVTLIVHEGGHGILARANGMKLKSLGLLWLVVPIGAFVEPEELDLKVAPRRVRLRVFGAGPAVNLAFAAVFLTTFALLMGSLTPNQGAWIGGVSQDARGHDLPAKVAGIQGGDIIVSAARAPQAGTEREAIADWPALSAFLNHSRPGQDATFGMADGRDVHLTLVSVWSTLGEDEHANITAGTPAAMETCRQLLAPPPETGSDCAARLTARARAGVNPLTPESLSFLADPFQGSGQGFARLAALPVAEVLSTPPQPILTVYMPAFYSTPFHAGTFWVLANLAFWVFWINLMVGITNILPMLPLDGGHIFREAVGGALGRLRPGLEAERRDRIVTVAATAMSFLILGAFVVQIVAPHFLGGLR